MYEILEPLLNLFSREELETAKPIQNICEYCKKQCGHLFLLDNCEQEVCGQCLDKMYDDYIPSGDELFKCSCHDRKIFNFTVK